MPVPSRPLRVLMLPPMAWAPRFDAHRPGLSPDPRLLLRLLADEGIETIIIDPFPRPWNPMAGRNTLLESLDPLRALRVLARGRAADLVVSVFEGAACPLLLLRRLTAFRVPILLWDIGLTLRWWLRERVLDLVVPRADGILTLTTSQVAYIEDHWQRQGRAACVAHFVDAAFYRPQPLPAGGPVLSIGEDVGRDFATLNAAAAGLPAEVQVKTRHVLPGPLAPNLVLVDRWLDFVALRDLYAAARVVAIPLVETLNASGISSLLEAMAMGKPIVVTATTPLRDFVVPGETCLTVPPGDPLALRQALQLLLDDPALAARLGANARAAVERSFSTEIFARGFAAALRRFACPG